VIFGSPSDQPTWDKADELLKGKYRHASGYMMGIAAAFIDSGGANTQDVYNFTRLRQHRHIFSIKGASTANKPIIGGKPSLVDINWMGRVEKGGAKMWLIGTDTAKDYLASRYRNTSGPGTTHFSQDLTPEYYKQLTAEYRVNVYKRGRRTSVWDKKKSDSNEAGDLMVYNLAVAYYLGLNKKTPNQWQMLRDIVDPQTRDLFTEPAVAIADVIETPSQPFSPERSASWKSQNENKSNARAQSRHAGRQW
jgi:phage terminase large subunit GpA-like protein